MKPVEGGVSNAYGGESMEEDGMGDGVEGRTQIKENEDEDGVSCHEEVVSDFDEGCFSAMEGTETGLELFVETVVSEMGVELRGNRFF